MCGFPTFGKQDFVLKQVGVSNPGVGCATTLTKISCLASPRKFFTEVAPEKTGTSF